MLEFQDVVEFYIDLVSSLKKGTIGADSPLDTTVTRLSWDKLAYVDNRRDAKANGYDFWKGISVEVTDAKGIGRKQLYSESQEFPDFIFKTIEHQGKLICGTLLETKDTRGGSISSFNSTIPTATKSLKEIDAINNSSIVSIITGIKDQKVLGIQGYRDYQRKCFYLIRTHRGNTRAKMSLVDGSFFETVPKDYVISRTFINIIEQHYAQKKIDVTQQDLRLMKKILGQITDQTIIASSQSIERASIKPRLRIMAEVNPEGNPHNQQHYPEIADFTVNFIISHRYYSETLRDELIHSIPELEQCTMQHKRNGKYEVFQYKLQ